MSPVGSPDASLDASIPIDAGTSDDSGTRDASVTDPTTADTGPVADAGAPAQDSGIDTGAPDDAASDAAELADSCSNSGGGEDASDDGGPNGFHVFTATSGPVIGGFVSQSVSCPGNEVALGGGSRFTDCSGAPRDGMVIGSTPLGSPPTGWAATGSTQYSTLGGLGVGDRIQVYVVCAVTSGLQVTSSTSDPLDADLVTQSVDCPATETAMSGGAVFTSSDGGACDGMLMNSFPTGGPPTGWAVTGSIQYDTAGGRGVGGRIQASAVCSVADAGAQVVVATSGAVDGGFVSQSVDCPPGQFAIGGGVMFTDATDAGRDGMLMNNVPVGNPPTSWAATGSTQYSTTGGLGVGDRVRVYAVCVW